MGGIIGKLSFETDEPLARPVLEQMLDAVRHRGNGPHGFHCAPGIALLEFWFREFVDDDAAEEPAEYAVLMRAA